MAKSEDTQQLTVGRPNLEIIYFKLTEEDLGNINHVVTRLQVTPGIAEPGAFTARNHSFSADKPGAFTPRNHNFSTGSYHYPHRQATRNEG